MKITIEHYGIKHIAEIDDDAECSEVVECFTKLLVSLGFRIESIQESYAKEV